MDKIPSATRRRIRERLDDYAVELETGGVTCEGCGETIVEASQTEPASSLVFLRGDPVLRERTLTVTPYCTACGSPEYPEYKGNSEAVVAVEMTPSGDADGEVVVTEVEEIIEFTGEGHGS